MMTMIVKKSGVDEGIVVLNAAWNVFLMEMTMEVGKHSLLSNYGLACWCITQRPPSYYICLHHWKVDFQ